MSDFFFRTEDIKPDEVLKYFVESSNDRKIIDSLKSKNPVILVGSRGVGKSFLLRVAQKELEEGFEQKREFPVYVSFVKSSLIHTSDPEQFKHWMLARLLTTIIRSLTKFGLIARSNSFHNSSEINGDNAKYNIEKVAEDFENSWKNPNSSVDTSGLPTIDYFKDTLEDLCEELNINRFVFLIDEAAHIFLPAQQRQFFTLFRDLRSHHITCNAAIYPGVTSFGETFQPVHDATMINIDRDIFDSNYIEHMREIVEKQADSSFLHTIAQNGKNFAILAYAAMGNPRLLLKTTSRAPKLNSTQINETIRAFYRTEIWSEHSTLSEKYVGHKSLIDWGRSFIESSIIPEIKMRNENRITNDSTQSSTNAFFWIHRDAPELVKEAIRILAYTGIVVEHAVGIKASSGIGKRYMVNLGCLFSLEQYPASVCYEIAKALVPNKPIERGANHMSYKTLQESGCIIDDQSINQSLLEQLARSIDVLDLTNWLKEKLIELNLLTVGQVLTATETDLKQANYVGDIRARNMKNAAEATVLEYLSG